MLKYAKSKVANSIFRGFIANIEIIINEEAKRLILISKIQYGNNNSVQNKQKNQAFTATPRQILESLPSARICPGRKGFLESIAKYFERMETKVKAPFEYKLGVPNELPRGVKRFKAYSNTFKEFDEWLNTQAFKCSEKSSCSCGKGLSTGQYAQTLLSDVLNLEKPGVIEVMPRKATTSEKIKNLGNSIF